MEERRKKIRSRYVRTGLAVFTAGLGLLLCYYMMYSTTKCARSSERSTIY